MRRCLLPDPGVRANSYSSSASFERLDPEGEDALDMLETVEAADMEREDLDGVEVVDVDLEMGGGMFSWSSLNILERDDPAGEALTESSEVETMLVLRARRRLDPGVSGSPCCSSR